MVPYRAQMAWNTFSETANKLTQRKIQATLKNLLTFSCTVALGRVNNKKYFIGHTVFRQAQVQLSRVWCDRIGSIYVHILALS
jgi:hypothetical protein